MGVFCATDTGKGAAENVNVGELSMDGVSWQTVLSGHVLAIAESDELKITNCGLAKVRVRLLNFQSARSPCSRMQKVPAIA